VVSGGALATELPLLLIRSLTSTWASRTRRDPERTAHRRVKGMPKIRG
jgi:hypothetical protein